MLSRRVFLQRSLVTSSGALLQVRGGRCFAGDIPDEFQMVRQLLRSSVEQGKATGVALAVLHRGEIVWEEGVGHADRERGVVSTPHTSYSLASITKAFTATLVAGLAQDRQIRLDSGALPYLKASPLAGPNGNPNDVTIRMLGAHASGLPSTFSAHLLNGPAPALSTDAFLKEYGHLAYPPGHIYEYGNIGFEALGELVEGLTREPFGQTMEKRLLQPLGLSDSFFAGAPDRMASSAAGYDDQGRRIPLYRTSTPPSGELYASAHDLALFAIANLRGGAPGSALDRAVSDEVRRPVFEGPRGISTTFGWFRGRLSNGEPYFFKGGGQPGVAAKLFFLPSVDVGCAVVTNRTDNMPLVEECCGRILRRYVPDFAIPEEDAGPASSQFAPGREVIGEWKGRLVNGGADQPVRFSMKDDGSAMLALSDRAPQPVRDIKGQAPGFEGVTSGLVDCEHAAEFGVRTLVLKLIPYEGRLIGRVTARGTRPGLLLANIPYVLRLERV